jgi:hypothetical protein
MHITASVFINDDESGLHHDYEVWLEKIAPPEPVSGYRHNVGEDNWWPSPTAGWISAPGNRYFTVNLMGVAANGCWSKLLENERQSANQVAAHFLTCFISGYLQDITLSPVSSAPAFPFVRAAGVSIAVMFSKGPIPAL